MTAQKSLKKKKGAPYKAILFVVLCLTSLAWGSYAPVFVEDLKNLDSTPYENHTFINGITTDNAVTYNGKMLFFACDMEDTLALWCTTGTQSGTFKIKDLQPNRVHNAPPTLSFEFFHCHFAPNPTTHGAVFLFYDACSRSVEFWRTDGTATGTQCIKTKEQQQLNENLRYSSVVSEGIAFFWFVNDDNQFELWRTEGTSETTCCFAFVDTNGRVSPSNDPLMSTLQPLNEPIYMEHFLTRGTAESTLFATGNYPIMLEDGAIIGTDFNETTQRARLLRLEKGDNSLTVYKTLSASEPLAFAQLPIRSNQDKRLPRKCNRPVYFLKGQELFRTDGTSSGTQKEYKYSNAIPNDFSPYAIIDEGNYIYLHGHNDRAWFAIYHKSSQELSMQEIALPQDSKALYAKAPQYGVYKMSNGIFLSMDNGSQSYLIQPENHEVLYFDGNTYARELFSLQGQWHMRYKETVGPFQYMTWWRTDGTEEGSYRIVDTCPIEEMEELGRGAAQMLALDDGLWLKTPDERTWIIPNDSYAMQTLGYPLSDDFFSSIPTQGNYRLISSSTGLAACDNDGRNTRVLGNSLAGHDASALAKLVLCVGNYSFFHDIIGRAIYRTDGTPEGTVKIAQLDELLTINLSQIGDKIISLENLQIAVMDLNGENRSIIYTFPSNAIIPPDLTASRSCLWNEKLYFIVETTVGDTSTEALWVSDGTSAGTYEVGDTPSTQEMVATPSQLILKTQEYTASSGERFGIWRSDGTSTGTCEVLPQNLTKIFQPIYPLNEYVFFLAMDENDDVQMWRTDGTTTGTLQLTDIDRELCSEARLGTAESYLANHSFLTATYKDRFYFQLPNYPVLFESDGTIAGTRSVHRFWKKLSETPFHFSIYTNDDCLFYDGIDIDHNHTLWKLGIDSDGDGIADDTEASDDQDADGKANYLDDDSDGDGIKDITEGFEDLDQDGIINALDLDSDGDGIDDAIEGSLDSDGDGIPNYLDADSDQDGVPDRYESILDPDSDGIPDYLDTDSDGDGVDDFEETQHDTDGDGIPDTLDNDIDGDGISNETEGDADPDNDGIPNYLDTDSDGDGASDQTEWQLGADPYDGVSNLPLNPWLLFLALLFLLFILIPKNSRSKDA